MNGDVIKEGSALQLSINNLDPIETTLTSDQPAVTSRNGEGLLTSVGFAKSIFATAGVVAPVTDPSAFPIAGVQGTVANSTASFVRGTNGNVGGFMPLIGQSKVCLFAPCSSAIQNLSVPIAVVGGPTATTIVSGAVNLTVRGAPWTQATAAVGTSTLMGNAGDETQFTNGDAVSNVISLVTPIFVSTNIGASAVVPVFGVLNFTVASAPEPASLAVLGAAIASLVGLGFARRR
jgi:hypothetical protein